MMIAKPRNQFLFRSPETQVEVWIKRLDELDPEAHGNKLFKLKYNFEEAHRLGYSTILTFGGAYSNHIAATASLGKRAGFQTIGVIRGKELGVDINKTLAQNPTLKRACENGMKLHFVSRSDYREKNQTEFLKKREAQWGDFYRLPEGGTNPLAVKGCEEILTEEDDTFDLICCAVGTGGTLRGIIKASKDHQKIWGFSALKADLSDDIRRFVSKDNWKLFQEDYFGGFAKINNELVSFMNRFAQEYDLSLDPVYTGKMLYALHQKLICGKVPAGSRVLIIHSGGLQGISGMNKKLKRKKLSILEYA